MISTEESTQLRPGFCSTRGCAAGICILFSLEMHDEHDLQNQNHFRVSATLQNRLIMGLIYWERCSQKYYSCRAVGGEGQTWYTSE
ncbi:hypothetical protein MRB53_031309 [Persea americana]|uniref:Uncharacterized protein n=1 Tax=Persea americana TaxID=3435 RepID=A0ACC2KP30_PERAE|nr:hypothetical protein MRB53_031309 [Persea americana]